MSTTKVKTVETSVRGRCLFFENDTAKEASLLFGFHGYGERADLLLRHLQESVRGIPWHACSVEALHYFYLRRGTVGASWMTKFEREERIRENLSYLERVESSILDEFGGLCQKVYLGFSQGVSMAYRAAFCGKDKSNAVIAVGGDVPPDLDNISPDSCGAALVCHGASDKRYHQRQFEEDVERLTMSGVRVRLLEYDGGHEWTEQLYRGIREFLVDLNKVKERQN